ncbi:MULTISPECIES: glycine betaine ABC transporter substrate-binding protein [unclassified Pseudomonas]|uniref:glycine betaine ABC transporter substrate-binding protein n=1 Tax=unclassified Pseudomonas TaxID=196821 RepID=UPI0023613621|nr:MULTISPECIES: glycine betaine ABC transporter substrate-binding protein [unclassified Pseudomonas]MDR6177036.1 glycine betaine/proline transport system substrate-binding protein [Pseudomonas sp. SORGH_AS_0211]
MNVAQNMKRKVLGLVAVVGLTIASQVIQAAQGPVRIGWVNWSDAEITAKLAQVAIEDQLKLPVKLVQADIGIQFQALANGSIDLIPMVWLPTTHAVFVDKHKDRLTDLGVLYEGKLGMAVPESVPQSELSSIEDLQKPEVRAKLDGKILSSEVGNGQYKLTEKAFDIYQLKGYKIVASSEVGMLTEMERNLKRGKWSVINAWSPHWMFSKWKLRYLDDPKGVFGTAEQIHAMARKEFPAEYPQVATFFADYHLPAGDLQQLMLQARDSSADKVVADYYAAHKQLFTEMFNARN